MMTPSGTNHVDERAHLLVELVQQLQGREMTVATVSGLLRRCGAKRELSFRGTRQRCGIAPLDAPPVLREDRQPFCDRR